MRQKARGANTHLRFFTLFLTGMLGVLALPLLHGFPWFSPPNWTQTTVFQVLMLTLLFVAAAEILLDKNAVFLRRLKNRITGKPGSRALLLYALFGYVAVFFLATLFSSDAGFSLWGDPRRGGGGFVSLVLLFFFSLVLLAVPRAKDWRLLWQTAFGVGFLVALVGVVQQFDQTAGDVLSTVGGIWILGMYLLLLLFPALAFALRQESRGKQALYAAGLVVFGLVILFTKSQAAYIGLGVGAAWFLLLYPASQSSFLRLSPLWLARGKIVFAVLCVLGAAFLVFLNTRETHPFSEYPALQAATSWQIDESRVSTWRVSLEALREKPLFGYGPENFSIAYDKHYDPALPLVLPETNEFIWDRAHNIFLDIGVQAGMLAVLLYIGLLGAVLATLQKAKTALPGFSLQAHGMQAALLAYLAANFFSFDGFATHLLFFFFIGYTLYLQHEMHQQNRQEESSLPNIPVGSLPRALRLSVLGVLGAGLLWYVWTFALQPLHINGQINKANALVAQQQCEPALELMEQTYAKQPGVPLNAYVRVEYKTALARCIELLPAQQQEFAQTGYELLRENTEIRPRYLGTWVDLTGFLALRIRSAQQQEAPAQEIARLRREAQQAIQTAQTLAPNRSEVYAEWAQLLLATREFEQAKQKARRCQELSRGLPQCQWLLAMAEISSGNSERGQALLAEYDVHIANDQIALKQLLRAYIAAEEPEKIAETYQKLVDAAPRNPQYRAALAAAYKNIGEYEKAREQAVRVLELQPAAKESIDAFLESLPQ